MNTTKKVATALAVGIVAVLGVAVTGAATAGPASADVKVCC